MNPIRLSIISQDNYWPVFINPNYNGKVMFRDNHSMNRNYSDAKLVENLGEKEFAEKLSNSDYAVLIDVRTQAENQMIRIPNSILLDISNPYFLQRLNELNREHNYFLYCRSGNRSFHAGNQMLRMGFDSVYNLQPGIIGWKGETEKNNPSQ